MYTGMYVSTYTGTYLGQSRILWDSRFVDGMFRRAFLSALSAIPRISLLPDRFQPEYPAKLPSEGSLMFWSHFYAATQRGTLSTDWARQETVDDLELDTLGDDEAIQFLRLASDGLYDVEDMPEQWHGIFETMERER